MHTAAETDDSIHRGKYGPVVLPQSVMFFERSEESLAVLLLKIFLPSFAHSLLPDFQIPHGVRTVR